MSIRDKINMLLNGEPDTMLDDIMEEIEAEENKSAEIMQDYEKDIEELYDRLAEKDKLISELQAEVSDLDKLNDELTKEQTKLRNARSKASDINREIVCENKSLKERVEELEEELKDYKESRQHFVNLYRKKSDETTLLKAELLQKKQQLNAIKEQASVENIMAIVEPYSDNVYIAKAISESILKEQI